ncbi:hypothetical protein TrVFT333_004549 [Trichoderma virens FT-333]|nr:hypothetical protein TrVFT333_004549 [Trichoderma virens FT-333]
MAEQVDVLICGSGSAGLCAAVWLARSGINYKVLERRPGPLENGQADGVQCRTVEIFESFGIAEDLLKEAYHVLEVAFWAAEDNDIKRTHYTADTEPGLSHQPHVILNQARVNNMLIQEMQRVSKSTVIEYGCEVQTVEVDDIASDDLAAYCITTTASSNGQQKVFRSKYLLACDGAHSAVRKSLGFTMVGDSTNAVWGVMDIHAKTDFPDIRKKAIIQSHAGNLMIIPREGDSMVRFYIELGSATVKDVTLADLQERASRIFHPYSIEFMETVWWSAYSIGQRLADNFEKAGRVFLTGDACHTHSPKAGQGMNVSLQDGFNIGWKLAAVLRGQSLAKTLETYVSERQKTAAQLIDFDRFFTKLFSSSYRRENGITSQDFKDHFVKAGRYTAGQGVQYEESVFISPNSTDKILARNVVVGMRFPSAQVVRFCDARPMQLMTALPADSRWHVIVFAGDILQQITAARLAKVAAELQSIIHMFTPRGQDANTVIQGVLVLASKRIEIEQKMIPDVFTPETGKWKIKHLQKVFVDDVSYNAGHGQAYQAYGIHPEGCLIVVRPDQFFGNPVSLEQRSHNVVGQVGSPVVIDTNGVYIRVSSTSNGGLIAGYTAHENNQSILRLANSSDRGASWHFVGEVYRADSSAHDVDNAMPLQLPSGRIVYAYRNHDRSGDLYTYYRITLSYSDDGGASFLYLSTVEQQAATPGIPNGLWEPFLRLAADGSLQCYYSAENNAADQDGYMKRSTDGGVTWSNWIKVSGGDRTSRDGMIGVTNIDNSGNLIAVFENTESGPFSIDYVLSHDDGNSWGERARLYTAHNGANAGAPQVVNVGGTLVTSFMTNEDVAGTGGNGIDGAQMKVVTSTDGGSTWSGTTVTGDARSHWPGLFTLDQNHFLALYTKDGLGAVSQDYQIVN